MPWLEARAANDGGTVDETSMQALCRGWDPGEESSKDKPRLATNGLPSAWPWTTVPPMGNLVNRMGKSPKDIKTLERYENLLWKNKDPNPATGTLELRTMNHHELTCR